MSEWQPIETAPKDGTKVLLWCTRGSRLMADREIMVSAYNRGWWTHNFVSYDATHWMPLPDPPTPSVPAP